MGVCNVANEINFDPYGFILFSYSYKGKDSSIRSAIQYRVGIPLLKYGFKRIMRGLFVAPVKSEEHVKRIKQDLKSGIFPGARMMFCYLHEEDFRNNFGLYELTEDGDYDVVVNAEEWEE